MKQSILLISVFIYSLVSAQDTVGKLDQQQAAKTSRGFFDDISVGISLNHSILRGDASGLSDQFQNEGERFDRGDIIDIGFGIRISKHINRFFDIGLDMNMSEMTGGKNKETNLSKDQRHTKTEYLNFNLNTRFYFSKLFSSKIRRPILLGYAELGAGIVSFDAQAWESYGNDQNPWTEEGTALNLGIGGGIEFRIFKNLSIDLGTRYNFTNSDDVDAINEDITQSEFNDGFWLSHLGANLDLSKETANTISHKWHFGEMNFDGSDLREIESDKSNLEGTRGNQAVDTVYIHTTDTMVIHKLDTVVNELKNIIVNNNISNSNRKVRFSPVYFGTDSYLIRQEQITAIEKVAFYLLDNPGMDVTLSGHADKRGSDAHNNVLSQRRVEAVKKVLVNVYNIESNRIDINHYGENNLKIDQDDINRRVDFKIR